MSLLILNRINGRLGPVVVFALCVLGLTSGVSGGMLMSINYLEGLGSWLVSFIAGIALVASAYAIVVQARQEESTSLNIALGRLGELYNVAHKDQRLSSIIVQSSDPHGNSIVDPDDISPSPQQIVWIGSLFLTFEQIFVATLTLSPESQRVWRLYLKNQLNKPYIRAAFVRGAAEAKDFHNEFWRFVKGVPCRRDGSGYRNYAIHPRFFKMVDYKPSKLAAPVKIDVKPFEQCHGLFWLEIYSDQVVQHQMYAAPINSEKELVEYLSSRLVYTVFIEEKPIGGFTISKEKDRMGTFGIVLHPSWRSKGISTQIMREIELKAREHDLLTLRADVYSDNYPCIGTLEKSGFRRFVWFEKNISPNKAGDSTATRFTPHYRT